MNRNQLSDANSGGNLTPTQAWADEVNQPGRIGGPVTLESDNMDLLAMSTQALRIEGLRIQALINGNVGGPAFTQESIDAANARVAAINERLRLLHLKDAKLADIRFMSLLKQIDEEYDRIMEGARNSSGLSDEEKIRIKRRLRELTDRETEVCRFVPDHSEDIWGEDDTQRLLLGSRRLPRFLFRGSNAQSGGNTEFDGESSDDGNPVDRSPPVRMINSEDRIVPHAHLADPQLLNHPKRHTFDSMRQAALCHVSARRFNTPFTSWTCDFETAVYFAIGHFPGDGEGPDPAETGSDDEWVFHDVGMPATITVIDTWTIPDHHLRVFHHPAIMPDDPIPSEFLIYGALDRADGIDLRGVSVNELRARLNCPQWPRCPSRIPLPHRPTPQHIFEAVTIARAYMQDEEAGLVGNTDLSLVILAGELSRQQWRGLLPHPSVHEAEAKVQIQWPEMWLRRIRKVLDRILPGPIGARMSGIALANAGTPYVGFPQFRLMQQLLMSWVMDYPGDLIGNDGSEEDEDLNGFVPAVHSCTGPSLLDVLTDLELAKYRSQMVQRERDGNAPVPPPREYNSDQVDPSQSTAREGSAEDGFAEDIDMKFVSNEDAPTGDAPTGDAPSGDASSEDVSSEDAHSEDAHSEDLHSEEAKIGDMTPGTTRDQAESSQERLGLRGGGYQRYGDEVPVTFGTILMFFLVLLLICLYFHLVLAVY